MKHEIPHNLTADQAKAAAEAALRSYGERFAKYSPRAQWTSDTRANVHFTAKGVALQGVLEITRSAIAIEMKVPFLLRPFQSMAIEVVEREVRRWIEKASAGQL